MTTIAATPRNTGRTASRRELPAVAASTLELTEQEIAVRAFELYCGRGCQDGYDLEDWLRAEHELQARRIEDVEN